MTGAIQQIPDGVRRPGGILDRIVDAKIARLSLARKQAGSAEPLVLGIPPAERATLSFSNSLARPRRVNIIAELKHRSPSKGIIRQDYRPGALARGYQQAGAAAMSVLCEEDFFGGSLDHLREVRQVAGIPLLRKDFVFDEYQIREARAAGADAVLLITAILDDELLSRLIGAAESLGLEALVEVHNRDEMRRAAACRAHIIGVNNRDLKTFQVDLRTSLDLAGMAPAGAILVSESGIGTADDILRLREAGYHAFLIGERFMAAPEPGGALQELIAEAENGARQS